MEERIQKIIARAGVASRRHAEQLIRSGQVTVNGKVISELGARANAERDHIKVCGKLLRGAPEAAYLALNKPAGCVAAMDDPEGRPTIRKFLHGVPVRVFPVGLLEYHAQGLLLLTNDGELANRFMREPERLSPVYEVKIKGRLSADELRGVEGQACVRLRLMREGANPWYEARAAGRGSSPGDLLEALREGMTERGHPVEKVRRVALGPLELGKLEPGQFRFLAPGEIQQLNKAAGVEGKQLPVAGSAQATAPRRIRKEPRRAAADARGGRFAGGRRR